MSGRLALRVLSDDDVGDLHGAALAMLGESAAAAERAAAEAPSMVVFGGRQSADDVVLDGTRSFLATGGPAGFVRRTAGVQLERATVADLTAACRLADALPEVGMLAGPPLRTADATSCGDVQRCLETSRKHLHLEGLVSEPMAHVVIRMAAVITGGDARQPARPLVSFSGGSGGLEPALVFAHAGLPVSLLLDDAPHAEVDLASALARHHAAALRGCLAIQQAAPGAPFLYPIQPCQDPVTCEPGLFVLAATQLAGHVRLPVIAAAMATSADEVGWRACSDNALASLAVMAGRGVLVSGAGSLDRGRVHSPQALVMDAELFSWNTRLAAGIPVDAETLALEEIKRVGIGGNYLGSRHTRAHMRDVWRPRLLDRSPWDSWLASGGDGAPEKANRLVDELLEAYEVQPLGREVHASLTRIVAESGL